MQRFVTVIVVSLALCAGPAGAVAGQDRVEELMAAVASNPADRAAAVELGNHFFDAGDWTQAKEWYLRALELDAEDPNVLTDLAVCQNELGEPLLALRTLDRALAVEPGHWQALHNKAVVLLALDRRAEAAEVLGDLEALREDHPDIPDLAGLRARAQALPVPGSETPISPELENAARAFIRIQVPEDFLEEVYQQSAQAAAMAVENQIQPAIGRAVTESEHSRLIMVLHTQMKELLPYSVLEDLMFPIVAKYLTLEDLRELNAFFNSDVGRKYTSIQAVLARESRIAGELLGQRMADGEWGQRLGRELKRQFPQWFPDSE